MGLHRLLRLLLRCRARAIRGDSSYLFYSNLIKRCQLCSKWVQPAVVQPHWHTAAAVAAAASLVSTHRLISTGEAPREVIWRPATPRARSSPWPRTQPRIWPSQTTSSVWHANGDAALGESSTRGAEASQPQRSAPAGAERRGLPLSPAARAGGGVGQGPPASADSLYWGPDSAVHPHSSSAEKWRTCSRSAWSWRNGACRTR